MAFTHGTPCPYKVGNHRVLICIWDVGTRRAESGCCRMAMDWVRGERLMGFTHGTPCPYKVGNHRVLHLYMGRRDSACRVGGVLSGGDGLGAWGAFDGVHTRHAVSV